MWDFYTVIQFLYFISNPGTTIKLLAKVFVLNNHILLCEHHANEVKLLLEQSSEVAVAGNPNACHHPNN